LEIHEEVPNGPEAPQRARRLLEEFESRIPNDVMIYARVVLSEIVTNSYKHSGAPDGAPIEITVKDSQDVLRLEVIDRSIFDPTPETSDELRSAKWGLVVVDRIADRWGRISEGGIWAEFHLEKRAASRGPRGGPGKGGQHDTASMRS
jgi:anti-sigma regulatory factor (Ser/Thr protein kinase)